MPRNRPGASKVAHMPDWVEDVFDQKEWNGRFIKILSRDYTNLDSIIAAILTDDRLSQICAVKIRSYVDKRFTIWWYEQRKVRGAKTKEHLKIAIAGLNAAVSLYKDQGKQAAATYLGNIALDLSGALGRWKEAYSTKRHGRDRAHSILHETRSFLESRLNRTVTYTTLANLVSAGYEADGKAPDNPVTEEQIWKNLSGFERKNPVWSDQLVPRLTQFPLDPETK